MKDGEAVWGVASSLLLPGWSGVVHALRELQLERSEFASLLLELARPNSIAAGRFREIVSGQGDVALLCTTQAHWVRAEMQRA